MWRISGLTGKSSVKDIQTQIEANHGVATKDQSLFMDPGNAKKMNPGDRLSKLKLKHGDIVYLKFVSEAASTSVLAKAAPTARKAIAEDGSIVVKAETVSEKNAVRPGLGSLRSRKLHWTMDELMQLESNYTFRIKRQTKAVCNGVSMDMASAGDFQMFCQQQQFQVYRGAWMYGKYVKMLPDSKLKEEDAKAAYDSRGRKLKVKAKRVQEGENEETQVRVECLYEPPQQGTADNLTLLEDPNEDYVESTAKMLGLERVGFIFSHPKRKAEGKFHFQSNEVLLAAENQLLAGDEKMESPFVTVKVFRDDDGNVAFEGYQMSKQCLEMVAEGAITHDPREVRGCLVSDAFSALVEAKEVDMVDNDFFLCNVPIMQHSSNLKVGLTQANRPTGHQWMNQPSSVLSTYLRGKQSVDTISRFSDFQVLLMLGKVLDKSSTLSVCASIVDRSIPLEEGHKVILDSLSGM
eukprot:g8217.t1